MSFVHYLKTLMRDVTITNHELLAASLALRDAKTTNALASVKLSRLRKIVGAEAKTVRDVVDETAKKYAATGADGAPIQQRNSAGQLLFLLATGTAAYEMDADAITAQNAELKPVLEDTVTLSIAPLTAADLAAIELSGDVGSALLPFVDVE